MSKEKNRGCTDGYARTDLACEAGRPTVESEEQTYGISDGAAVSVTRCREADGTRYTTLFFGRVTLLSEKGLWDTAEILSDELCRMTEKMIGHRLTRESRILVAGLGNAGMTADAIGPETVRRMAVTRHLKEHDEAMYRALGCCELSAVSPGVLGQTGIESGILVKGAVEYVKPHLLVAVDALAARSCDRLASTIQLSDRGIAPGAGIGQSRMPLTSESMGCPVLGIGVPTVVDSATLVYDALIKADMDDHIPDELRDVLENGRSFIVSPKDSDAVTDMTCRLLARAINLAFGVGEM